MKYCVLNYTNKMLVLSVAPEMMPPQLTVEQMKDYLMWQQTRRDYLVKQSDYAPFIDLVGDLSAIPNSGYPIPYQMMEIYTDNISGKKLRLNSIFGVKRTKESIITS